MEPPESFLFYCKTKALVLQKGKQKEKITQSESMRAASCNRRKGSPHAGVPTRRKPGRGGQTLPGC
jgi:hypothetical protein